MHRYFQDNARSLDVEIAFDGNKVSRKETSAANSELIIRGRKMQQMRLNLRELSAIEFKTRRLHAENKAVCFSESRRLRKPRNRTSLFNGAIFHCLPKKINKFN